MRGTNLMKYMVALMFGKEELLKQAKEAEKAVDKAYKELDDKLKNGEQEELF
ncbi:MAG: hypothetical protein ACREHG_02810 [Candidatus Saccharimonadales bacterium]